MRFLSASGDGVSADALKRGAADAATDYRKPGRSGQR